MVNIIVRNDGTNAVPQTLWTCTARRPFVGEPTRLDRNFADILELWFPWP